MKKSILLFILIALTVLLASCYQDEVIDFRDKTENFRCEVTVEETNEHYFIYGEDAEYLMSLCKKEWETAENANGTIYSDLDTIRLRFMADIKDEYQDNLKDIEKAFIFNGNLVYNDYLIYSNNKGYQAHPNFSNSQDKQCGDIFYASILDYLNSINY